MADRPDNSYSPDLWDSLHDGNVESVKVDASANRVTLIVDSPFHWEFHKLPPNTRFRIIGEEVNSLDCHGSITTRVFLAQFPTEDDFIILSAELSFLQGLAALSLGIMRYPTPDYVDLKVTAGCFRYFIDHVELSFGEFTSFGSSYWEALDTKAKAE